MEDGISVVAIAAASRSNCSPLRPLIIISFRARRSSILIHRHARTELLFAIAAKLFTIRFTGESEVETRGMAERYAGLIQSFRR